MNQKPRCRARASEENTGNQLHIISEAFACHLRGRGYARSTIDLYGRIVASAHVTCPNNSQNRKAFSLRGGMIRKGDLNSPDRLQRPRRQVARS